MAKRRASRAVLAREKARALNVERRRREQQLEDLATRWFEAESTIADIDAATQTKIDRYCARARSEAERETGRLRGEMADAVSEMLKLAGIRSVAERLGVPEGSIREVRPPRKREAPTPVSAPPAGETTDGADEELLTPA
ncbi:hypothetical protein [Streptomyces sp. RFCAC02]|uniref:hypothetical protein n=1 Tax=Streptomyces sp. RFCAC02 TaxID=2499143 RepID=UPI001021E070|nr:hypothetical protein [Streptomyces sp. RFCAC02]